MSKAEQIRERLLTVLGTIDADIPSDHVHRNRGAFEAEEFPIISLLDGSTNYGATGAPASRGLQTTRMTVTMPQIFVALGIGEDHWTQAQKGAKLALFEDNLVKALIADAELSNLLGEQGYIEYRSSVTDFQTGSTMEGQMQMDFAFAYIFNPKKL